MVDFYRPKLSKSDQTRIQIIEAAIRTYATLDINYVSYEDIAREAGISRPLVRHYFPDKLELFVMGVTVIGQNLQRISQNAIDAAADPQDQLIAYIHSVFFWLKKYREHARAWLYLIYLSPTERSLRKSNRRLTQAGEQRFHRIILAGIDAGIFRVSNPQAAARGIQRILTTAILELLADREVKESESVCKDVVEISLTLLNSTTAQPP